MTSPIFKVGGFDEHVWLGLEMGVVAVFVVLLLCYFHVFEVAGVLAWLVAVVAIALPMIAMSWHSISVAVNEHGVSANSNSDKGAVAAAQASAPAAPAVSNGGIKL